MAALGAVPGAFNRIALIDPPIGTAPITAHLPVRTRASAFRVPARAVAAPPGVTVAGAHPVPATGEVDVGPMAVHMRPAPDAVEVEVGRR